MSHPVPVSRRDVAIVMFVTSTWGVAFVGIKEVLQVTPPLTAAGVRFALGGALLMPLLRTKRGRRPTWREVIGVGLLQTTGLYGLGFLGIERATAGASALLINTNPVIVALFAIPFLRQRLRLRTVAGLATAVAGVALISVRSGLGTPAGIILLLLAAVSWAGGSILVKRSEGVDLVALSCLQMLVGAVPLLAGGLLTEHRLPRPDVESVVWFVLLVVVATSLNFVLWFRLLDRYGAVPVTSWLFLIPVFGVLAGVVFLDESITWRLAAGTLLVIAGVVLSQNRSGAPLVVDAPG